MPYPGCSRREWLSALSAVGLLAPVLPLWADRSRSARHYHLCLSPAVIASDAGWLTTVQDAGVTSLWLAGYFYGHRPYSEDVLRRAIQAVERAGMEPRLVTVPLGHPGDSLGANDQGFPLTPPRHWQMGRRPDGTAYAGTSLHPPATNENATALRQLRRLHFRHAFLDDDFRLARGPGEVGGCFCADHRGQFLRTHGFAADRWDELLDDVRARRLTSLLRAWLDFNGAELSAAFRAQRHAFGRELGIMVMYLGAEKAGIRLSDYRRIPLRVGELMFDDSSFGPVKGKTDELFSVLFHRRFVEPERAFSETTAYPADRLSAANLAAKLVISTLADVRQTLFMSGLTPFPREHWRLLGPAMRRQKALHAEVAGHRPRGPFKHYWGEAERQVGEDRPFSLWLATGVPFEVVEDPSAEGWTFLSDFDAREHGSGASGSRSRLVCRAAVGGQGSGVEVVSESLPSLFALKRRLQGQLGDVPHVEEDEPAVCAWYPTAAKVLVWNLSEAHRTLTVVDGQRRHPLVLGPLEAGCVRVAERSRWSS